MVLLDEAVEAKKFDVRVSERNIERGFIKMDDYSKSLKSLPDDAENAEWISIESIRESEGGSPSDDYPTSH